MVIIKKETPLLMNSDMVRMTINGKKTQTRRLMKPQPDGLTYNGIPFMFTPDDQRLGRLGKVISCPYGQVGDKVILAKEIPGIPDIYCAGSDGAIYSKSTGNWLRLIEHKGKYQRVSISNGKTKTTKSVHSLVCTAFYGAAQFAHAQVRHLDGDCRNNKPSNLAWVTQSENWLDRRAHGNGMEGEKHFAAKFNDDERAHISWAIKRGLCSARGAARALDVSPATITQMLKNWSIDVVDNTELITRIPEIKLEITGVRVEQLRDINRDDAKSEGVDCDEYGWFDYTHSDRRKSSAQQSFDTLWQSIYGIESWAANPWVWVIEFKRITP